MIKLRQNKIQVVEWPWERIKYEGLIRSISRICMIWIQKSRLKSIQVALIVLIVLENFIILKEIQ